MTAGYESLMFLLISDNQDRLSGGKNLPEILQGYPQHYGGNNEYSYHNLLWRMDKICPSDKPYCTVASGVGDLYRNLVLCERLAGRTRILLKQKEKQVDFVKYLPVFLKQTIDCIYIRFLTTM